MVASMNVIGYILPFISQFFVEMFSANFVWFDVDNCKTRGFVKIQRKNQRHGKLDVLTKNGYVSPASLLKDSIWTKTVVMLYCASHYQHVLV